MTNQNDSIRPSPTVTTLADSATTKFPDNDRASQAIITPSSVGGPGVVLIASAMTGGALVFVPLNRVDELHAAIDAAVATSKELWATQPLTTQRIASLLSKAEESRANADRYEKRAAELEAQPVVVESSTTEGVEVQ
jgi:acyl-CoA reductase-like NAD-dependent aldehyde dehydrogenase